MASIFVAPANKRTIDWGYAILAGILAMIVFAIVQIVFAWAIRGASPVSPLVAFGTATVNALAPSAHPGGGIKTAMVGVACLLALGALSGIVLAYLVDRLGVLAAALVGLVFGLAMYAIDMYGIARLLPALAGLRDWMSALAYAIQGALAAALYKAMMRDDDATVIVDENAHDLRDLRDVRLA